MKKNMVLAAIIILLFFSFSLAFSGERRPAAKDPNKWQAYNQKGEVVGTIIKEKERFIFYDKDEIKLKEKGRSVWGLYNQNDEFLGTLEKDKEKFRFYDKQEKNMGLILESKNLMPSGHRLRTTQLTPEAAKLYLGILEAIKNFK
jgi:hypothetical protein